MNHKPGSVANLRLADRHLSMQSTRV